MRAIPISLVLYLLTLLIGPLAWSQAVDMNKELRLAASIGDDEAVAKLLDAGANVNAANKFNKTALMMAVENDNLETVALLLARGADVNARTVANCTVRPSPPRTATAASPPSSSSAAPTCMTAPARAGTP